MATKIALPITGDTEADQLLTADPFALLLGMMLDQQIAMETAFLGPYKLQARIGDAFSPAGIAAMDVEALAAAFSEKPAVHRFPASMAKRAHELCCHIVEHYDGDTAKIWRGLRSSEKLYDRIRALPGFGDEKSMIFLALLAKRFGRRPAGWEAFAGPFADDTPRSVADVATPEHLPVVRAWKKQQKAAGKSKQQ